MLDQELLEKAALWWYDKYVNHRWLAKYRDKLFEIGSFKQKIENDDAERMLTNKDEFVNAFLETLKEFDYNVHISIDYHPEEDKFLRMFFKNLGKQIAMYSFPSKLDMLVCNEGIMVRDGHYDEFKILQ